MKKRAFFHQLSNEALSPYFCEPRKSDFQNPLQSQERACLLLLLGKLTYAPQLMFTNLYNLICFIPFN